MKVSFATTGFSSSKINTRLFHVNNEEVDTSIRYYIIISYELMVQLGVKANFRGQIMEWDKTIVPMKELGYLLGKSSII